MRRPPLIAALTGLAVAASTALGPAALAAAVPAGAGPLAAPVAGAAVRPEDKLLPGIADARGTVTAFVRLAVPSTVDVAAAGARPATVDAAEDRIEAVADAVVPETGPSVPAGDDGLQRISVTTDVVAGTVVRGDADDLRALARSPHVAAVYRVATHTVTDAGADVVTRALDAWRSTGRTGAGVRIGVVDTGVDYTHATFGGAGTPEAYAEAYGEDGTGSIRWDVADRRKFLGGHDLAGPRYDADGTDPASTVPVPDANPLDPPATPRTAGTAGHGTHVAGTAAGFGVGPDGTTFRGDHATLTDVAGWPVGPGAAPGAGVYALKVVGDAGDSTDLVLAAMDRAADPDGDNDFGDHLDVLAIAMGSDGAPADAPENLFADRLAELGVLTVASAGNAGDVTDVGAAPGSARSALTVAWSVGGTLTVDAVEVTAAGDPALVGRHAAQASLAHAGTEDVTAPVTYLGPDVTGCTPLTGSADRLAGTVAYLAWDDDPAARECGTRTRWDHARDAGAVGVLLGTEADGFPVAIGGNADLPGAQLTAAATEALLPQIAAGTVTVRLGPSLRGTGLLRDDTRADTLSPGSSRGVHGSLGVVKPDVAAPGESVVSAAAGAGTGGQARSGTSMATAHVAGTAALVREARPGWTPAQVKAAVVNTATHDVRAGSALGPVHGPTRVGSGRVDALDAVRTTTIARATHDPAGVSVAFGVVPVGERVEVRRTTVTVENHGPAPVRYRTGFRAATTAGGASITASPAEVEVAPGGRRLVTLTLTADPATLARDPDPASAGAAELGGRDVPREHVAALSGRLVLVPVTAGTERAGGPDAPDGTDGPGAAAGGELRVPVHAAPRRVADVTARPPVLGTPGDAVAPLELDGRAVASGGWTSHVAAMALVGTSPRLEPTGADPAASVADADPAASVADADPAASVADAGPAASVLAAGDVRHVGFTSTAPALGAAGRDPADGVVGIGIATHGEWASLGTAVRPVVDVDVDGDGEHELRAVVAKASSGGDLTTAHLLDAAGTLVDELPVNLMTGEVDTTVFDHNVVVVPLRIRALGLSPGQVPTFRVWTYSSYAADPAGVVDGVEPFTADPFAPEYHLRGGPPDALLVAADPGAPPLLHRTADPTAAPADLLVLHTHNATPATRVQVLAVRAPVARPTGTTLDVAGEPRVGSDLTLTAAVEPADATGAVTFTAGDRDLATAIVVDGAATATVRLPAGPHRLTARFVPDGPTWLASVSDAAEVDVARATSSTTLTLSRRATTFGQATRATVRVVAPAGSPAGTVEVRAGDRVLASGDVVTTGHRGTAVLDLPRDLPVGAHRLHAVYVGDDDVAGSTSDDVRVRVTPTTPDVTVDAPSWTVERGSRPVLTVTVAGHPGGPRPTGVITVLQNLRRVDTVRLGGDGTATVTLPRARDGALVTVLYGGDAGHQPAVAVRVLRVR